MNQKHLQLEQECPGPDVCEIGMCGCRWLQTGDPWPEVPPIIHVSGHDISLRRVQCVSPVSMGNYRVTLVSGWELVVGAEEMPREQFVALWRRAEAK